MFFLVIEGRYYQFLPVEKEFYYLPEVTEAVIKLLYSGDPYNREFNLMVKFSSYSLDLREFLRSMLLLTIFDPKVSPYQVSPNNNASSPTKSGFSQFSGGGGNKQGFTNGRYFKSI